MTGSLGTLAVSPLISVRSVSFVKISRAAAPAAVRDADGGRDVVSYARASAQSEQS